MKLKRRAFKSARSRTDILTSYAFGVGSVDQSAAPAGAFSPPSVPSGGGACSGCGAEEHVEGAKFCASCGAERAAMATVPVPPTPVGDDATAPTADPVGEEGIDDGAVCATPDCGHLASEHANIESGDNMGSCTLCACAAMTVDTSPNPGSTDDSDGGIAASGAEAEAPSTTTPDAPIPPGPSSAGPAEESDQNAPPEVDGGESMGPQFTIPVLVIENQPTVDGRRIAAEALTWRTPPIPLMGLATETHDPNGYDLNDPAVICGRIDSLERVPGEGDTQIIEAHGYYLPNEDGMYFAELNEAMGRMGISADIAVEATEITIGDVDADGWPIDMSEVLTEGTILGATVVPYPAFEGAYIALGDGAEEAPIAEPIPQQTDAPQTPDALPDAIAAGGQLLRFVTYEECEPCQQGLDVVTASGGPTRPPAGWFENPNFTVGDERLVEILDRRGERSIGGKYACPLTVTEDGRVFGHLAPWDVCHTGVSGQCIIAPHSAVDYAHFKRGQHVVTAEGEQLRVGVLTVDAGHAPTSGVSPTQAMAHYDNTALAAADVNIGEDEFGIWVAGAMRPEATEEQVRKLRAASISGDWRAMGGRLELVAALCVNQPGFPLAVVAAGHVEALVAAGTTVMDKLKNPDEGEVGDQVLRRALAPMLGTAKSMAQDRLAALRP